MSGSGIMTLPGLGRPFDLGMLYDCRSDKLITDIKLWNEENLAKDIVSKHFPTADFNVSSEDTIESKSSALGIEAGLKLSVLGGLGELVSLSGSAKYLDDRNSSDHQSRVTLAYKNTIKFQHLTMNHLDRRNVQDPGVFDEGRATHLVTGVMYGSSAFFVFDKQLSDGDVKKNIDDELLMMVEALPRIQIDEQGSVKMSEEDAKKVENLQVSFYGDIQPSPNRTTYEGAVKLYKDLSSLLKGPNEEKAVPVKVWLYPLEKLDSKAARLVREISTNIVTKTEQCVEEFDTLGRRCNDLGTRPVCCDFPGIGGKLGDFDKMVKNYKEMFMERLGRFLPEIRGGHEEESILLKLFDPKEESPFKYQLLKQWLDKCEMLIHMMEKYTSSMKNVKTARNTGRYSSREILDLGKRFCVCFSIKLTTKDQVGLLSEMKRYISDGQFHPSTVSVSKTSPHLQVKESMAINARRFVAFHSANAVRKDISFILAEDKEVTDEIEGSIQLYHDGNLIDADFKPPSKPEKPNATSSAHDALSISWQRPEEGEITEYRVSYKISGYSNWLTRTSSSESFDLRDLTARTSYEVKVAALCEAGSSLYSDVNVIKTRPTNPTSKPNVWQASLTTIRIEWERPKIIGENIVIKSYDIERRLESDQDGGKWRQCGMAYGNSLSVCVAQERDTPYRYRIVVNCGDEKSNPSPESDVIIIDDEVLKEQLRCQSRMIENVYKQPLVFQVPLSEVTVDSANMIRKFSLGEITPGPEKVILIVGAAGTGKTTFLNGILNYVLGVKWEDDYRFRLVDEGDASNRIESQTEWITAYTLHHQLGFEIPYTLTVIDTPGIGGHEMDLTRDKRTMERMWNFLSTGAAGVNHVDAIGFVTQSSPIPSISPSRSFIFDSIRSSFSKDVEDHIFLLVTFADGQKPPVLAGVNEARLPYSKYFKFNNSALFAPNRANSENDDGDDDDGRLDRMFWNMGVSNYKKFLDQMSTVESRSPTMSKVNPFERPAIGIQKPVRKKRKKLF